MDEKKIIEFAIEKGIEAADKHFEALKKQFSTEKKDRRLYNTKLLIRNYRMFKAHAEKSVYDASKCEDNVFDILAMMSDGNFSKAETTVKAIKNSAVRTAIMVRHIMAMVDIYEIWCKRSGKPENERRCRVLKSLYINDNPSTPDEIAEAEKIDKRTVYRDIDAATEILSALIFGIESLQEL